MGVVLTDAAPGFQNVLDRRIDSGAARLVLEQCVQRAGHLQEGGEGVAPAAKTVRVGKGRERRARTGEAAGRQKLEVVERCRGLGQCVPRVGCQAIRQVWRRRGHDVGLGAHGGALVRPMDIEQMAGVAEGVLERNRRGGRIDLEREGGDPLPVVLSRVQAHHHQAALRRFLVAKVRKVLDLEPPRRVFAHGASSIS